MANSMSSHDTTQLLTSRTLDSLKFKMFSWRYLTKSIAHSHTLRPPEKMVVQYGNDSKYWNRNVLAHSVDSDQAVLAHFEI